MAQPPQPLRPFDGADNIPQALKANARWAPWRAVWSEKRQKWDKIPRQPNGYGLSTAKPDRWLTFDAALAAYRARPDDFAGLGYVMTGPHGLVGVDLDHCVDGNTVAPWALEIVQAMGTYTELSPSGTGLRCFARGEADADWTNHEQGIEVYAGHEPRFLTVTGQRLRMSGLDVVAPPEGLLASLAQRYARAKTTATVISLNIPDLIDDLLLPDVAALDIPYQAKDFLLEGTSRGDRSRELFSAAVALYGAGLDDAEVLSVLAASPHAYGVALDHRRQDNDRALMYLWVEHAQKAKGRAGSKVATVDDFDDVSEPGETKSLAAKDVGPAKPARFAALSLVDLLQRPRTLWTIKRVLPQSGVGMVYGPSMSGKSFFVMDLCMAVARGTEWRARRVKQGTVAYIAAEGMGGFPDRVRAYGEFHGVDLEGVPMHVIPAAPNLLEREQVKELVGELRKLAELRVVVVDTLAQTTAGGDENASKDIGTALAHCKAISEATGALVLLVGHTGKDEEKGPRGHSSQIAAFDVAIRLERDGDLREATIAKLKDGQGEGDAYPFHLGSVVLGQDEDGEDITSCVVLPGLAKGAQAEGQKLGLLQRTIYDTAVTLLDFESLLKEDDLIAAVVASQPKPPGEDNRRRNVKRELPKLVKRGMLLSAAGYVQLPQSESAANDE